MAMTKLTEKEWAFLIGTILTGGIAWGSMTARQQAQDEKINSLVTVPESVAAIKEHLIAVDKRTSDIQLDVRDIKRVLLSK